MSQQLLGEIELGYSHETYGGRLPREREVPETIVSNTYALAEWLSCVHCGRAFYKSGSSPARSFNAQCHHCGQRYAVTAAPPAAPATRAITLD